jgi:methyl-accepting chemotaxis protein
VIQRNASGAEEVSATSEELSAQAEQLQHAIGFFKVEDGGRRPSAAARLLRKSAALSRAARDLAAGHEPAALRRPAPSGKRNGVSLVLGEPGAGGDPLDKDYGAY